MADNIFIYLFDDLVIPYSCSDIEQILLEAQHRWLRPAEICEILRNYRKFHIAPEPPNKPPSMTFYHKFHSCWFCLSSSTTFINYCGSLFVHLIIQLYTNSLCTFSWYSFSDVQQIYSFSRWFSFSIWSQSIEILQEGWS